VWGLMDESRLGIRQAKSVKYSGKSKYTDIPQHLCMGNDLVEEIHASGQLGYCLVTKSQTKRD
jgi:hypothetical protein